ncbi:MAG: methyltransferase domain-containing protein [Deltaproteobacteria bacterium]|nr:methyltransferase domain-containing protein [Deltaproteobacteria bacterium]
MPNRDRSLKKYREGYARTFFDRASAPTADPHQQEMHVRAIHFRQQCVDRLALKPGETVLDVGCGTGLSFAALENGVGSEGRIIGIDQSLEQLAQARNLAARNGWQNITLLNSPVEDAQIPVTADAALFYLTHDIMRTTRAVHNIVSSLRDGGRIVVMGRRWVPWWKLLTNWRTWQGARRFVTTFEGFWKSWSHLERLVSSLEVEMVVQPGPTGGRAGTYVAVARK